MEISVGIAFPPHRDEKVAEFHVFREGLMEIPAEIYREKGQLRIALYSQRDGIAWEYRLSDFLSAIAVGIEVMEPEHRYSRPPGASATE